MSGRSKPVLVTGGCGFVGRNLVRRLLSDGVDVLVLDDLSIGERPEEWLTGEYKRSGTNAGFVRYGNGKANLFFKKLDVLDIQKAKLPRLSDVYHLASIVGGRELIEGNPILVAKDLAIDSIFFNWVCVNKGRIERVLYASSSAAYPVHLQGERGAVALKESDVSFDADMGLPDMTYGWSKLTGEYLSRFAAKKYGVHIACVRPFSGYGEDQDLSYPVPAIASRVVKRENPLTVWGTGRQGRDFVHVDDCIEAFFVVLDNVSDGSGVNIGSGRPVSFLEVIEMMTEIEGYKPRIKKLLDKPVGVSKRYANISLISSYGWEQKVALEYGLERVLNYRKTL